MMIEKIGHIKNPLSIIAVFAALAEISGTIVLPFIENQNQSVYMWFLMLFPFALLILFFLTLNFNHRVLYAPSDYKDERLFADLTNKATSHEKLQKIFYESQDVIESNLLNEGIRFEEENNNADKQAETDKYKDIVKRSPQASYMFAEELVLNTLSQDMQNDIERSVKFQKGNLKYIFDGVCETSTNITFIEVKYFRESLIGTRLGTQLKSIEKIIYSIPEISSKTVNVILAIATELQHEQFNKLTDPIGEMAKNFNYPLIIRVFNIEDLKREFLHNN
jgi:hypothetical protein